MVLIANTTGVKIMTHVAQRTESIINTLNNMVEEAAKHQQLLLKKFSGDPMQFAYSFLNMMEWGSEVKPLQQAVLAEQVLYTLRNDGSDLEIVLRLFKEDLTSTLLRGYSNRSTNAYHNAAKDDEREVQAWFLDRIDSFLSSLKAAAERDAADAKDLAEGITRTQWRNLSSYVQVEVIRQMKELRVMTKLPRDVKNVLENKKKQ
jgi:hypothetical protein